MPVRAFLDTSILVYAFSLNDPRKRTAEELILSGATVGIQTLNEFVNVERNKAREKWSVILHRLRIIEELCPPPVPLTRSVHLRGLAIAETHGYHVYDSMMLSAALEADCTVFYSEDLHDGHAIENLTIRNPFN